MVNASGMTLVDYIVPARASRSGNIAKDSLLVLGCSLLLALCAQISFPLPFTPVPITLQTLGVVLIGAALGKKRGTLAVLLYLVEGVVGLPFFAGGSAGIAYLSGVTAGYLWAFPIAAFVTGLLCELGLDRSYLTAGLAMLPGALIIEIIGFCWLSIFLHISLGQAFLLGSLPFLPGDLVKLVIAVALLPSAWRLVRLIKPE
jgi:biotin transport system substrate-specific component